MADQPDVYATARGPLARLASPLAARARAGATRGSSRSRTCRGRAGAGRRLRAVGLRALEPELDITGVDLAPRPKYPGPFVQADAAAGLPFADGEFDLVYCSSVIEHVPPARRAAFAAEIRRVGRGWFVQTPACSFPMEPHALLPFAHWLPAAAAPSLLAAGRRGRVGGDRAAAPRARWRRCSVRRSPERAGPLVKSWVCVRAPTESRACCTGVAGASRRSRTGGACLPGLSRRGGRCRC